MSSEGYVDDYPCRCGGGDICYIVRYPNEEVDISYPTRKEAEKALEELRSQ